MPAAELSLATSIPSPTNPPVTPPALTLPASFPRTSCLFSYTSTAINGIPWYCGGSVSNGIATCAIANDHVVTACIQQPPLQPMVSGTSITEAICDTSVGPIYTLSMPEDDATPSNPFYSNSSTTSTHDNCAANSSLTSSTSANSSTTPSLLQDPCTFTKSLSG